MGRLASQDAGLTSMDTEDLCHCTGTGPCVVRADDAKFITAEFTSLSGPLDLIGVRSRAMHGAAPLDQDLLRHDFQLVCLPQGGIPLRRLSKFNSSMAIVRGLSATSLQVRH